MSYKLELTITKRENDQWFLESNAEGSIDYVPDQRDRSIYNETERSLFEMHVRKLRENINDYLGWKREYIGSNSIKFTYIFESEASARLYYNRYTAEPRSAIMDGFLRMHSLKIINENIDISYSYVWVLKDPNGDSLTL